MDYKVRRRRRKMARIFFAFAVLLAVAGTWFFFPSNKGEEAFNNKDLAARWKTGAYDEVFALSERELAAKPMDFFLLLTHGLSAYQMALAQINSSDTQAYVDRAIWALRKAQLTKEGAADARVKYALGKAYFYKGPSYANLCIKYLEEARKARYKGEDIPQFLGLAYAQVQDYRGSVAAFSEALKVEENGTETSDLLLLAMARSYVKLGEGEAARPYIVRAMEVSRDFDTISAARLMRGTLMVCGPTPKTASRCSACMSRPANSYL
jgi:tetratricopeptide (TPR) repeat protein